MGKCPVCFGEVEEARVSACPLCGTLLVWEEGRAKTVPAVGGKWHRFYPVICNADGIAILDMGEIRFWDSREAWGFGEGRVLHIWGKLPVKLLPGMYVRIETRGSEVVIKTGERVWSFTRRTSEIPEPAP